MNQENQVPSSIHKSDAVKAALLSAFVVPGAGQIYNRQWAKGIGLCILFLAASLGVLIPITLALVGYYLSLSAGSVEAAGNAVRPVFDHWMSLLALSAASVFLYVYSIIDAYRQPFKSNR